MSETQRQREGVQRVQAGLIGLAGVVLMVGLANIVIDRADRNDRDAVATSLDSADVEVASNMTGPSEPLAELGVTPASGPAGPVVPDLKPDPNLHKPMDHDPPPQGPLQP